MRAKWLLGAALVEVVAAGAAEAVSLAATQNLRKPLNEQTMVAIHTGSTQSSRW
jgi:hypothetical protein